ncbi:type 1 glutamine amidotransferase domain-containing protein [Aequorivita marina]|uniref:type 1 glutamine amidotransferase domain-containing protein n=1 Tax=Aequorivita marina TaxID=3073654 RepID=UPI0028755D0F|nr:type 1 glutamine amidotransferase domain-containing protein [Aequorivita sp. S2608]MDS1297468.1 type 1 glutamine amidotransferase domain-containing protein [Aequorivita sp. S2608]
MKQKLISLTVIIAALITSCGNSQKDNVTEVASKPITKETTKKVLFVLTSHSELGNTGEKTGFWIEEFAAPYYILKDNGIEITIASPKGGQPPIDPRSEAPAAETPASIRFKKDSETQAILTNTVQLKTVDHTDFDAVFYPGGHGPLWDLVEDENSINLIESFYKNNKTIAAVCHAPAVFKNTKATDGSSLVKGKKVTGFSNSEEDAVQLTNVVPFLVEDMLKEKGGEYSKKENWAAYAVEDGLLITGQNPASSELVAEKLLERLNK